MENHKERVANLLITNRDPDTTFWVWLVPGQPASCKEANKFFLASILDYQMRAEVAWGNARRLAEQVLGDTDRLWEKITEVSLDEWNSRRKAYSLHRFPKGHERVYTIGKRIVSQYGGDVRKIWNDQSIEATLYRLNDLGVGEQISRMIVGALHDTGHIEGKADVKVDLHVRRVLGRILQGAEFSMDQTAQVIDITRAMSPDNPWLLDRPLYRLGKSVCTASDPQCQGCFASPLCVYRKNKA